MSFRLHHLLLRGPFWPALAATLALLVGALAVMALTLALSLRQADRLLDRLSRSQEQLAMVTRIEADISRLRADALEGRVRPEGPAQIVAALQAYRASIAAEARRAGGLNDPAQQAEARNADQLAADFAALQTLMPLESAASGPEFDNAQARFDALAGRIITTEREEARTAISAMRDLRSKMTLLGVAIPILVALGAAAGAWIMLAQMAERTREIEAGRQKLAEIDRTRRLFYSQIGHELRTPVTVIRGETEVALRDPAAPADRLREALEHVAANGAFLQRRLEDLLLLARSEDGRIALQKNAVDLGDVVRRTSALAEPYLRSSGARLATEIGGGAGPTIIGDASWLQQGLLALVDNAAKFSGPEGVIRLSFAVDGGLARIAVTDAGPGVDAADLPHLFDTHYQTAAGRARGGSGLGLSVARWVVEQHGGRIGAESRPASGLTVRIELPVAS